MTSNRSKGLVYVREVRKVYSDAGYLVEGPGYDVMFFSGAMRPVHKDYFECFDLIVCKHNILSGIQVTTLENKSHRVAKLQEKGVSGYVWCRSRDGRKVEWRVFRVSDDDVVELPRTEAL